MKIWRAVLEHRSKTESSAKRVRRESSIDTVFDPAHSMVLVECQRCKCSPNPTVVIGDGKHQSQVNGDETLTEYYGDGGIVNL